MKPTVQEIIDQGVFPDGEELLTQGERPLNEATREVARRMISAGYTSREALEVTNRISSIYRPAVDALKDYRVRSFRGAGDPTRVISTTPTSITL